MHTDYDPRRNTKNYEAMQEKLREKTGDDEPVVLANDLSVDLLRVPSRSFADEKDPAAWAAGQLDGAGVENARFEAQLLLAMTLGVSRAAVVAQTYAPPNEEQLSRFLFLVEQRKRRVPLAYLRGTQEFYGREFVVTPAVLIPRPETELLVEKAGELLANDMREQDTVVLADVGTGSGCIPVSIVGEHAQVRAVGFDISSEALKVAGLNAWNNGVGERLRFVRGDLLTGAESDQFDIIVSNPPYIASGEVENLQAEVRDYEPRLALDGGVDGLHVYRRLLREAQIALKPNGWLLLEVGQGQAADVCDLMRGAGYGRIQSFLDLAGIERVVWGQMQAEENRGQA